MVRPHIPEKLSEYFDVDWNGHVFNDTEVINRELLTVSLYECKMCRALVKDVEGHVAWHEGET